MYITKLKRTLICYEFFFSVSYFLCCFLVFFIINDLESDWLRSWFNTNDDLMYKTCCMCSLGYLFYMLGLLSDRRGGKTYQLLNANTKLKENVLNAFHVGPILPVASNWCVFALIVIFIAFGGINMLDKYNAGGSYEQSQGFILNISTYLTITYIISSVFTFNKISRIQIKNFKNLIKSTGVLYLCNTTFLVLIFLLSGNRSGAIQIFLPLIFLYNRYYRSISNKRFIILVCGGIAVLLLIGLTRGNRSLDLNLSFIDFVIDFVAANAANGQLIDIADTTGITYGLNYLPGVLAIIPGFQGILINFFPHLFESIPTSIVFTNAMGANYGLGTSLVGDIYYSLGAVGLFGMMYLWGLLISYLSRKSFTNIYAFVMFLVMFGNSVFAARVELPYILRTLSFSVIILYLFLKFFPGFKYQTGKKLQRI